MSEELTTKQLNKVSTILKAMSGTSKLEILYVLSQGEKSVNAISEESGLSQSLVSHALKDLKSAHLISYNQVGRQVFYRLDDEHVLTIINAIFEHSKEF